MTTLERARTMFPVLKITKNAALEFVVRAISLVTMAYFLWVVIYYAALWGLRLLQ